MRDSILLYGIGVFAVFILGVSTGVTLDPAEDAELREVIVTKEVEREVKVPTYRPLPEVCTGMIERVEVAVESEDVMSAVIADVSQSLDEVAKAQFLEDPLTLSDAVETFTDSQSAFTQEVAARRIAAQSVELLNDQCLSQVEEGP